MKTCSIPDCGARHKARGLCGRHLFRYYKHGDPSVNLAPKNVPVAERISAKTDRSAGPNGCWPFSGGGSKSRSGHRRMWLDGRMVQVHRIAWELQIGKPVPDGLVVRHSCDNPQCVNPAHLLVGTISDNNQDRDERGRHVSLPGSLNGNAKLTEADVIEIRGLLVQRVSQYRIAERFGISQGLVSLIHRGKAWSHV